MNALLIIVGAVLLGAHLFLGLVATIAVFRASQLDTVQKVGQILITWIIPLIGSWFVLRLMTEHDLEAIPRRWTPNEQVNDYVWRLLKFQSRATNRVMGEVLEAETMLDGEGGD